MTHTARRIREIDLAASWTALKNREPKLRIRKAAQKLGVSELDLLMTRSSNAVKRIEPPSNFAFLSRLSLLGNVMALARNDSCVHEKIGIFDLPKGNNKMALTLGVQDQRYFLKEWVYMFEVEEENQRRSIQIFDAYGEAIWKLYTVTSTNLLAWKALVDAYCTTKNSPIKITKQRKSLTSLDAVPNSNKEFSLLAKWAELTDVHQFQGMLKNLELTRRTAYKLAQPKWTRPLATNSAEKLLKLARDTRTPIMIFTANIGIVQIYTGLVKTLRRTGKWFNVLDPNFNLHLNTLDIDCVWQVTRPSDDGLINSVECFDKQGNTIVTFFGAREEGQIENSKWRKITKSLEDR